jgi:hypothetical protein
MMVGLVAGKLFVEFCPYQSPRMRIGAIRNLLESVNLALWYCYLPFGLNNAKLVEV